MSMPTTDADVCPTCTAPIDDLLELPGGRVVDVDDVPFGTGVRGVTTIRGCPRCLEPAEGRSNPGGNVDDVDA